MMISRPKAGRLLGEFFFPLEPKGRNSRFLSMIETGATDGVRTRDIQHHKLALYQLSYGRHHLAC